MRNISQSFYLQDGGEMNLHRYGKNYVTVTLCIQVCSKAMIEDATFIFHVWYCRQCYVWVHFNALTLAW